MGATYPTFSQRDNVKEKQASRVNRPKIGL